MYINHTAIISINYTTHVFSPKIQVLYAWSSYIQVYMLSITDIQYNDILYIAVIITLL